MLGSSWTPMTLQAIPNDGYKFVSWELYDRSKDQVVWNKTELTIQVSESYVNCYLAGLPATHENSKYTLTAYFEKTIDPTWQML